jgi:hypothetical protein
VNLDHCRGLELGRRPVNTELGQGPVNALQGVNQVSPEEYQEKNQEKSDHHQGDREFDAGMAHGGGNVAQIGMSQIDPLNRHIVDQQAEAGGEALPFIVAGSESPVVGG